MAEFIPKNTAAISAQEDRQKLVNSYIKEKMKEFSEHKFKDDNLWEAFKDEFSHFSEADFKSASISVQLEVCQHLRRNGVWVEWDRKRQTTTAKSLHNALLEEIPTEWTFDEISNSNETFNSVKILRLMKNASYGQSFFSLKEKATITSMKSADKTLNELQSTSLPAISQSLIEYSRESSTLPNVHEPDLMFNNDEYPLYIDKSSKTKDFLDNEEKTPHRNIPRTHNISPRYFDALNLDSNLKSKMTTQKPFEIFRQKKDKFPFKKVFFSLPDCQTIRFSQEFPIYQS